VTISTGMKSDISTLGFELARVTSPKIRIAA
jgi:hypothetical protein